MSYRYTIAVLLSVPSVLCPAITVAQEAAAESADSEHRVVAVRFAGRLLEQIVSRKIDHDFPVRTQILDSWCVGSGNAKGTVSMDFASAKLDEPLPIHFSGTMLSRSNGYTGPVVVTSQTRTVFDVVFNVHFDGTKFYEASSQATACCDSTIESLCATRGGLGRRLIERLGSRMAPREVPRYERAAARIAEAELLQTAGERMPSVLRDLNSAVQIENMLSRLIIADGYERAISKTDTYIQVRFAPIGQQEPLPPTDELSPESSLEIWVYPNSQRPLLADIAVQWQATQGLLRKLLPGLAKPDGGNNFSIAAIGDWDVVKIRQLNAIGASSAKEAK